jgi:hypothetical protein
MARRLGVRVQMEDGQSDATDDEQDDNGDHGGC